MTTALIDGDIVAYRAAIAAQMDIRWETGGDISSAVSPSEAADAALETIAAWSALAKCKDQIVAFTGRHNFRRHIMPSYKANRTKAKPLAYTYTVNAVQERFPSQVVDGLEADDILGILATTDRFLDGQAIVVTIDKDLRTIPGLHLNPLKDDKPRKVTKLAADLSWMRQTLTGDSTDGYAGIPNVGPKRAEKILPQFPVWVNVVQAYRKAGMTEADALLMARVARILRRSDYDKTTKEILLWHPTKPERLPLGTVCGIGPNSPSPPAPSVTPSPTATSTP